MIKRLELTHFTVFADATFEFGALNVVHGGNSTGKTHLLKLLYSMLSALTPHANEQAGAQPTKGRLESGLADELAVVFRPDNGKIGRLSTRISGGHASTTVTCHTDDLGTLSFGFSTLSSTSVKVTQLPERWGQLRPVYLPVRELLSAYPGFVSLYESQHLPFDKTWRDTCALLGVKVAKGPKVAAVKKLLVPVENAIGCKALLKNDRFYIEVSGSQTRFEIDLVAEGHRKLAMLGQLIANGSLDGKSSLFWDEPEANLNPELVQKIAPVLLDLADAGLQIFIATHSLFLLRELRILQLERSRQVSTRYFGLTRDEAGVRLTQGDSIEDSGDVLALDVSTEQAGRYLRAMQQAR